MCQLHSLPEDNEDDDPVYVARDLVLDMLSAPPDEYEVIFTSGATEAIRLVCSAFELFAVG